MHIVPTRPTTNFTMVSNEIIHSPDLTATQKVTWLQLQSLCLGSKETYFDNLASVAEELLVSVRKMQRVIKDLEATGLLVRHDDKDLELLLPSDVRERTGTKVGEQELSRDAWNKNAPKSYIRLRNPVPPKVMAAMQVHMEFLKFEGRPSEFVAAVLRGAKAHKNFWATCKARPEWIFGSGEPSEKKTGHVTELLALGQSSEGVAASFDPADESCWLEWFHSKGHNSFMEVERVDVSDRFEGWDHEVQNASETRIYVYFDKAGNLVHWTYKQVPSKFVTQIPTA